MNKKIYIMFAVVCLVLADAFAQQTLSSLAGNSIKLDNLRVEHTENSLLVKMNLDLDSLEMPSNIRFVFTPMVKYGEKHVLLPQIVLNGRKQDLSYRRWGYKKFSSDVVALRRKNDTRQTLNYSATLPFEAWMKNCNIEIAEDLCGCGGEVLDQNLVVVHKIRTPYLPYVRPKAEARKERREDDLKPQEKPFACSVKDCFREKEHGREQCGDGDPRREMFHRKIQPFDPVLFQVYDLGMNFMSGTYGKRKR